MKTIVPPERGWTNIALMSTAHFMSDFFTNLLPVLLPVLALRFDMSYSQSAALFTAFSVISSLMQPAVGILADKKDVHFLLPLSISLAAVFVCLIGLFTQYWLLVFVLMLSGICAGLFHPLSAGVVPSICPLTQRGLSTSVYIAGGNFGAAVAPLVTAAFVQAFSDKYLLALSIPAVITSLLIVKNRLHHKPPASAAASEEISLMKLVRSRSFLLLNSSISIRCWSHCAFITFIPLLYSSLNYPAMTGATALVVYLVGSVAGGLAAGSLADRMRLKHVVIFSYVLIIIFSLIFLMNPDDSLLSMVLLFLNGAAMYGATPVGVVWSQLLMPRNASFGAAMILGFCFGIGYLLTPITGWCADHMGLAEGLMVTAIPAAGAALLILLFVREPRRDLA